MSYYREELERKDQTKLYYQKKREQTNREEAASLSAYYADKPPPSNVSISGLADDYPPVTPYSSRPGWDSYSSSSARIVILENELHRVRQSLLSYQHSNNRVQDKLQEIKKIING